MTNAIRVLILAIDTHNLTEQGSEAETMRITLLQLLKLCAVICLTCGTTSLRADSSSRGPQRGKLPADLADRIAMTGGSSSELIDVIIQAEPGAAPPLTSRLRGKGSAVRRELALLDGLAASLTADEISELTLDASVRRVSPDRPVSSAMDVAAQAAGASWSRGPAGTMSGPTGSGVVVAVIDSGIYPHEDLAPGTVVAEVDFVDPARRGSDLTADPYGHGTHVAGIIAGRAVASPPGTEGWLGGIAPDARLVSLRVLDHKGMGRTSDVVAALQWCVEHRGELGLRVVNMSLGQPVLEPSADDPLAQAVERAWMAGLVVVASAGNAGLTGSGYGTVASPGNDPLVITVGALDDRNTASRADDSVVAFSSRGPSRLDMTLKPDLVAPGVRIVSLRAPHSTLDRTLPQARVAGNSLGAGPAFEPRYFQMSGTSMAAALVSGAVALMLETDPTLSPDDVKARLMRHADRSNGSQDIFTRGAGAIDVEDVLGGVTGPAAPERAWSAPSPVVSSSSTVEGGVAISETGATWGDPSLWSLEDLYGDPALWGEEVIQSIAFFEDPCMTGTGISWQHTTGNGISWQHTTGNGISWQHMAGSGISWQHAVAEGIVWQNLTGAAMTELTLSADGVIWQGVAGAGIVWQNGAGDTTCPY